MTQADIGVIGLAVMGQNLVLNMNDHGFRVAVYNRTVSKTDAFMNGPARGTRIVPTRSIEELVGTLKKPRIVMLMVKAGSVVDNFIEQLLPNLVPGDVIIDGGNSLYTDSDRRTADLAKKGIRYVGSGISGGEEGARHGPSIMPGGNREAWPLIQDILQSIAAKVDGQPCCDWIGENGSGHYVKMVHNGIEYGDMQLISEAYQLMREGLGLGTDELAEIFDEWNRGRLESYLIEITGDILAFKEAGGQPLVDKILDAAGQKGTGKWTGINALDLGIPLTLIGEAVFARCLSALKDQRVRAAETLGGVRGAFTGDRAAYVGFVHDALYASKIISYAQGFMLMREAAKEYGWSLNYGGIALLWRGGCIIRSGFLNNIEQAFDKEPDLESLVVDEYFSKELQSAEEGWRNGARLSIEMGLPAPAITSALAFYDGYRSARLPANLLQAQRDYFGAHTYERVDRPRGEHFHTDWTGRGGAASSSTYNV